MQTGLTNRNVASIDEAFYKFASYCYNNGIEAVFKGGCLLRHILRSKGQNELRFTKDIDFDLLMDSYYRLEELAAAEIRFGKLRKDYKMNIHLLHDRIDCDVQIYSEIDPACFTLYESPWGKFYGAVVEDILTDKIQSMSGNYIARRAKDIYDIFRISQTPKIPVDIGQLRIFLKSRTLGQFSVYESRSVDMMTGLGNYVTHPESTCRVVDSFIGPILSNTNLAKWTGSMWL
jgi:hypothetical protein